MRKNPRYFVFICFACYHLIFQNEKCTMLNLNFHEMAFFLDFDGTLVGFSADPEGVIVSAELRELLVKLHAKLNGALAIISGRSIRSLHSLLRLPQISLAGGHGAEWWFQGELRQVELNSPNYSVALERILAFAEKNGLLMENKTHSCALHFRRQPDMKTVVDKFIAEHIETLEGLRVIYGNCVREIQPLGVDKGKAIERFLKYQPFLGRRPVYIGDDTTDEDAFHWVNVNQGVSFKVGSGMTAAQYRLENITAVMDFLQKVLR